jgi:hypothetical protein
MTRLGPQRGLAPESRTVLHASGQNSRVLFSLRHLRPDEVGPFPAMRGKLDPEPEPPLHVGA